MLDRRRRHQQEARPALWGVREIAAGVYQVKAVASTVFVLAGSDGSVTLWDAGAIGSAGRVLNVVERLGFPADYSRDDMRRIFRIVMDAFVTAD